MKQTRHRTISYHSSMLLDPRTFSTSFPFSQVVSCYFYEPVLVSLFCRRVAQLKSAEVVIWNAVMSMLQAMPHSRSRAVHSVSHSFAWTLWRCYRCLHHQTQPLLSRCTTRQSPWRLSDRDRCHRYWSWLSYEAYRNVWTTLICLLVRCRRQNLWL